MQTTRTRKTDSQAVELRIRDLLLSALTVSSGAVDAISVGDITNWSATVAERRRLAGVLVSLFVGATAGSLLLVRAHTYAPVLPFLITVAAVVTAAMVLRDRDALSGETAGMQFLYPADP